MKSSPVGKRIEDYGLIGNCRTAALVSRNGALEWLCFPYFHSSPVFSSLLDSEKGGSFRVAPSETYSIDRRYIPDAAVLETTFTTRGGTLRLTDFMPVASEENQACRAWPEHQVVRMAGCLEGRVDLMVHCEPCFDYARRQPRISDHGRLGIWFEDRGVHMGLLSDIPLQISPERNAARGRRTLRAGERCRVSLCLDSLAPGTFSPLEDTADLLDLTTRWWRDWSGRCRYEGAYRDAVVRSALTLKLLTFAGSGAVIAAPTTSLPEAVGASRNWDYRFCWLRDASWTLRALLDLGYREEGEAFLHWLLHATRLTWPRLQPVYDVFGETSLREMELQHLKGFRESRPVRIGNSASGQVQMDVYGELIDAAWEFVRRGGRLGPAAARMLAGLGRTVEREWRRPDSGIWEVPGPPRHYTYSKVMCWVALDRLLKLADAGHVEIPVEDCRRAREAVRTEIETRGIGRKHQGYTAEFGGDGTDAALFLMALVGFVEPGARRMRATAARITRELGRGELLLRYRPGYDGLDSTEGAFGICSFWHIHYLAVLGESSAAEDRLRSMLGRANDLGLFAEQIDPASGNFLGNFPQAFTHFGLINAVLALDAAREKSRSKREHGCD